MWEVPRLHETDPLQPWPPILRITAMAKFFLWLILLVLCWPIAVLALIAYPILWIVLIPFKLVGIAVDGVLGLVRGIVLLPARVLGRA